MVDVSLVFLDNRRMRIVASMEILREIRDHFSFLIENYRFNPKVISGQWDGYIRLFHSHNHTLYVGLIEQLRLLCDSSGWTHDLTNVSLSSGFDDSEIIKFITETKAFSKGNEIFIKDHQRKAILKCLTKTRSTIISPTASGKSLIIYYLILWYSRNVEGKLLIVVPNISLVNQMRSDFKDYSNGETEFDTHLITSGVAKESSAKVFISTWQSIYKQPESYFSQFDAVFVDETHSAKAEALKGILEKADAKYRFGFTGTLHDAKANSMIVEGLLGPALKVVSTKELMDMGDVAKLKIKAIFIEYNKQEKKSMAKTSWLEQCDFIETHKRRNDFLCSLAISLSGNTLVLCHKVDNHLKPFMNRLKEVIDIKESKKIIYEIHGATKGDEREALREIIDSDGDDSIIVASFGVMSTGVNIKSIKNIIFLSSGKSKIRTLQSIGRGLRLFKGQELNVYDIIDLVPTDSYSVKHFKIRHEIYLREGFEIETHIRYL